MTKYHFEIVDGHTIEDPKGIELATERQARKVAAEIAKQMAGDSNDDSLTDVVVKNSAGEVVHKLQSSPIKILERASTKQPF